VKANAHLEQHASTNFQLRSLWVHNVFVRHRGWVLSKAGATFLHYGLV